MKCLLIYSMQIQGLFIQKMCICYKLLEQKCSFKDFIHVDTLAMGEFPHFKKLNWAGFWEDTYSNWGSHSEEQ